MNTGEEVRIVHALPGRVRLKVAAIKGNPGHAEHLREAFAQVPGVQAIEYNTLTGSLLIRYDTNLVAAQTLLNTLRGLGHLHPEQGHGVHYQDPGLGQKISDTLVNKLVETLLERSTTALVAALF